jgi:protease I
MPRVLMPIGDATETLDTFYPYFRLPEDGFEVTVAGPDARLYHTVLHEIPPDGGVPWDITQERPGYFIRATVAFRDVRPEEYAGLFVSGGRAPEYLRYDEHLLDITRHFFAENKPVAALCHGVEILTAAGCIEGRTLTTVAKCRLDIEQGRATYVDRPTVVDGNLVTARTWHDNTALMGQFIRMLKTAATQSS